MPFDFEEHRRTAVDKYARVRPLYENFSSVVRQILTESIAARMLKIHSIEARAKSLEAFGDKVMKPSDSNPNEPKYPEPLQQVTDLAGVRVITFFPRTVEAIDECINQQFEVVEKVDLSASLEKEERLGYQSVHYIVRLMGDRTHLPEYKQFEGLKAEIQVRTVMQHAWAEIEHDIQYKSPDTIPSTIRRRFMSLAGLLEIADREFQAIQDADATLREEARASVEEGSLRKVEITPDALKVYLDKRLGPDARMSDFSYEWDTRLLRGMGFTDFAQVDECIFGYDDDLISRILAGQRQGQLTRFEYLLLAGMGQNFLLRHRWANEPWFQERVNDELRKLRASGTKVGSYSPTPPTEGTTQEDTAE